MYEHPGEVAQQENIAPKLTSIMEPHVAQLPHFFSEEVGDLPRITGETMVDILDGKYTHVHDKVVIIDCRFEYEYNGGHINGAINFNDKEKLAEHLFDMASPCSTSRSLVIFHCEYSAFRAPTMAKFLRSHDRTVNVERYPMLTYPETYILDGGYSSFFKGFRSRCFPQEYVEMKNKEHSQACEMGMGKVKQSRRPLHRAATFAFGQGSSPINSSPIAARGPNRHASDTVWSPIMMGRAAARDLGEATNKAVDTVGVANLSMSDMDTQMELDTDMPLAFQAPTFGRPAMPDHARVRRLFSSYN